MNQTTVQYKRKCKSCQQEILLTNESGRFRAVETDNATAHVCKTGLERIPDLEKSPINERPPARPVMQVDEKVELTREEIISLKQFVALMKVVK